MDRPGATRTGAAQGLTTADLPDHAYWEEWFPADWVSEMREQIRLWFYSQLFMSVALTGRAPYRKVLGYEKMLDETGREMHGSWGNMIYAEDAFASMGADVMRWQYCAQPPEPEPALRLRARPGDPAQAAHALEHRRVLHPVREHRRLHARSRRPRRTARAGTSHRSTAGSSPAPRSSSQDVTDAYEQYLTVDMRSARSRRSSTTSRTGTSAALAGASGTATRPPCARCGRRSSTASASCRPVMPFLTEHLWQNLVSGAVPGAPQSVFLAGWPRVPAPTTPSSPRSPRCRRVVELGRQARAASKLKLRQPLRRLVVEGLDDATAYADEIADELRVKEVEFGPVEATELRVRPNLKVLGPRLGAELGKLRAALDAGEFEALPDGGVPRGRPRPRARRRARRAHREGRLGGGCVDGATVALDIELDERLRLEGRVYDLIHRVNTLRKEQGLALTDRIDLLLPSSDADLLEHADWIASETLAVSLAVSDRDELTLTSR